MTKFNIQENREIVAKALHKYECLNKTIYLRTNEAIENAWSADGRNRGLWIDLANCALKALDDNLPPNKSLNPTQTQAHMSESENN